jgi:hypothetical protein
MPASTAMATSADISAGLGQSRVSDPVVMTAAESEQATSWPSQSGNCLRDGHLPLGASTTDHRCARLHQGRIRNTGLPHVAGAQRICSPHSCAPLPSGS